MKKTKTIIETGDVLLVLAASNSSIGYMFLLSLSLECCDIPNSV